MPETLTEALERIADRMPLTRFFLPDGVATLTPPAGDQPYDRLLFVTEGVKHEPMSLDGEIRELELGPGDAYLVRKNIWEYSAVTSAHRLLCIVPRSGFLRVSYYDFPAGMRRGEWRDPEAVHTGRPTPAPLLAVFAALGEPGGEKGAHILHLLRAAAALALAECRRGAVPAGKAAATFERVRACLDYSYMRPVTREEVAARFGLTPNYLSDLFRRMTGRGFREYVEERRFDMAKRLLRSTALPVKAVAEQCGFSGEVYFIRRFRELFGRPPGRYRTEEETIS